jgi:hypothetical protein
MSAAEIPVIPALKEPTKQTLKKYGLDPEGWKAMADSQGHVCAVCRQSPTNGRLCIDHDHVKGWKKMPAERKVQYIRGLLCFRCNTTYVGRAITIQRSMNVTAYLQAFDVRRPAKP